jgi:xanthine dehydrogenase molybdopterin-binding subunit B
LRFTNTDGGDTLVRPPLSDGKLVFPTDPSQYPLTQPIAKLDSVKQTSGESQYVQDLPTLAGELQAVFVTSTIGAGEISSIDISEAESMPGIVR